MSETIYHAEGELPKDCTCKGRDFILGAYSTKPNVHGWRCNRCGGFVSEARVREDCPERVVPAPADLYMGKPSPAPPAEEDEPDSYSIPDLARGAFMAAAAAAYDRAVRAHTQHKGIAVPFVPSAIVADLAQLAKGKEAGRTVGRAFLRLVRSDYGEGGQVVLLVVRAEFDNPRGRWQEVEIHF